MSSTAEPKSTDAPKHPIKKDKLKKLLKALLNKANFRVDTNISFLLHDYARMYLKDQDNVIRIPPPSDDSSICVIGDIHGHFDSLSIVLDSIYGVENEKNNTLLFLGDYVDRGKESLRVFHTILCLIYLKEYYKEKKYPKVYLLRGNHETENIAEHYGYFEECERLYGEDEGDEVFGYSIEICKMMPLAAVIGNEKSGKYFCVHGGIGPETKLIEDIMKIDRKHESLVEDIHKATENYFEKKPLNIIDILWSDPNPANDSTGFLRSQRGCGYIFGEKETEKFCETNKVDLIIRSHEIQTEGYILQHKELCLTIFSCSNYCNASTNLGAICVVTTNDKERLEYTIVQYDTMEGLEEVIERLEDHMEEKKKVFVTNEELGRLKEAVICEYPNKKDKARIKFLGVLEDAGKNRVRK